MGDDKPWLTEGAPAGAEKHAPATARNRDAIVEILRTILPERGGVLEIASGTGEHVVYFAQAFPGLTFRPSDPDPECRRSIAAWTVRAAVANVAEPVALDALADEWEVASADAILCINMLHIAPWEAAIGLFRHAAGLLAPGAPLYLYGPFLRADVETAEGNLAFERSLKSRDLRWGLRSVEDMDTLAARFGFSRAALAEMPANNLSLVYRRS